MLEAEVQLCKVDGLEQRYSRWVKFRRYVLLDEAKGKPSDAEDKPPLSELKTSYPCFAIYCEPVLTTAH